MNMTEWDKMQEHQIYNDFDADLFDLRVEAKKLFKEFNRTEDEETERRQDIMRRLFKKIGERVWMEPNFTCEFGKNITIGSDVYINFGCTLLDCGQITIGNLSGVTIGDDSVIGAGSVVSHDIPSGVLAAGNPCRVIREITDKDKVGFIV